jgi:hypothetical protein
MLGHAVARGANVIRQRPEEHDAAIDYCIRANRIGARRGMLWNTEAFGSYNFIYING